MSDRVGDAGAARKTKARVDNNPESLRGRSAFGGGWSAPDGRLPMRHNGLAIASLAARAGDHRARHSEVRPRERGMRAHPARRSAVDHPIVRHGPGIWKMAVGARWSLVVQVEEVVSRLGLRLASSN